MLVSRIAQIAVGTARLPHVPAFAPKASYSLSFYGQSLNCSPLTPEEVLCAKEFLNTSRVAIGTSALQDLQTLYISISLTGYTPSHSEPCRITAKGVAPRIISDLPDSENWVKIENIRLIFLDRARINRPRGFFLIAHMLKGGKYVRMAPARLLGCFSGRREAPKIWTLARKENTVVE